MPFGPLGPQGARRLFVNRIGIVKAQVHRAPRASRRLERFVGARCGRRRRPERVEAKRRGPTTDAVKLRRVHGGCLGVMRR